jgi:hypothetical protein
MNDFVPVVREVKGMLRNVAFFNAAIDTVVLFLIVYCVLALFNFFPIIALPVAILFFFKTYAKKYGEAKLVHVEAKYPNLWERLRTAADTLHINNFIVGRLRQEVVSKLKTVSVSSFIDTSELAVRVVIICVLLFSAIFITSLNIKVLNLGGAIAGTDIGIMVRERMKDIFAGGAGTNTSGENKSDTMGNASFTDIYGNISVAKLGDEKLDMFLNFDEGSVDFKNIRDIEQKNFNEFPAEEVSPTPADYYEDVVPKDQQQIVKKYFEQISK